MGMRIFSEEQIVNRTRWLIKLRWMAVGALFPTIYMASSVLGAVANPAPLYFLALVLALCNAAFSLHIHRVREPHLSWVKVNAFAQSFVDISILTLLLHFAGGIENPFIFYFIFHSIIAGILFASWLSYLEVGLATVLLFSLIGLEYYGKISHHHLLGPTLPDLAFNRLYILGIMVAFPTTMTFSAYLAGSIMKMLWKREAEVIRERDKIKSVMESMREGVIFIDRSHKIALCNKAAKSLPGFGQRPVIGKAVLDFHPERVRPRVAKMIKELEAGKSDFQTYEMKTGDSCSAVTVTAARGSDGECIGTILVWRDISERKAMEDRIRGNNRQLRAINKKIMESQQQLSQIASKIEALINQAERERSFDVRYENPHLVKCWEVKECNNRDCPAYESHDLRCWQKAGTHCYTEVRGTYAQQIEDCKQCEVYKMACPDKLTEIGESFNNMMYILEQKVGEISHLQAQLIQQEKMAAIGRIAAGVAHEIGNPLTSIFSLVQMMERRPPDAMFREPLQLMHTHIGRISKIVRQMMEFSRPAASEWHYADLNQVVKEAIKFISYDKRLQKVDLKTQLAEHLPRTSVMKDQILQVFINLMLNALDAMEKDRGTLAISTALQDSFIRISFKDSGCGMDEEQLSRAFEPFYSTKEVGKGTGLGLSISYSIIQNHRGSIDVESLPKRGSTFTVKLPVRKEN